MVVAYRKKKNTKFKTGLITIYIYSIATVAIFEISTLKFIKFQSFARKKNAKIWNQKFLLWVFLG